MARIIVVANQGREQTDKNVVFEEDVTRALLDDKHASTQILERMAWALGDIEQAESLTAV